jgi:hypothetical protein
VPARVASIIIAVAPTQLPGCATSGPGQALILGQSKQKAAYPGAVVKFLVSQCDGHAADGFEAVSFEKLIGLMRIAYYYRVALATTNYLRKHCNLVGCKAKCPVIVKKLFRKSSDCHAELVEA